MTGDRADRQTPHRYEIRIRGHLGEQMLYGFPDLESRTCGDDTVLTGVLSDQSALYGVLAQIESLALELIEVRRLPGGPASRVPDTSNPGLEGGTP